MFGVILSTPLHSEPTPTTVVGCGVICPRFLRLLGKMTPHPWSSMRACRCAPRSHARPPPSWVFWFLRSAPLTRAAAAALVLATRFPAVLVVRTDSMTRTSSCVLLSSVLLLRPTPNPCALPSGFRGSRWQGTVLIKVRASYSCYRHLQKTYCWYNLRLYQRHVFS